MYVCVSVCMFVCMSVCVFLCMCVCNTACMSVSLDVNACSSIFGSTFVCEYACL
eukprot:NODE_20194_length_162_cov_0.681416_g18424_i0.p1 GENE.NODE_20194_length_162_cov_0.681416_g18424_i0~~NODE_20194_length_162_cov_0.681416_g18424_i0.p1  ORF type:complete len:54 (+),score=0.49 NODE_20194_length_162_cov_0.681416_g18424_i0:1-162(+)